MRKLIRPLLIQLIIAIIMLVSNWIPVVFALYILGIITTLTLFNLLYYIYVCIKYVKLGEKKILNVILLIVNLIVVTIPGNLFFVKHELFLLLSVLQLLVSVSAVIFLKYVVKD